MNKEMEVKIETKAPDMLLKGFDEDSHASEYSNIIAVWGIQDSLLQSYRSIFLTSQSVLFSISVFVSTTSKSYFMFFILPVGLYMLFLMYRLTRKRGYGVWYCQLSLLNSEDDDSVTDFGKFLTGFKQFMNSSNGDKERYILEDSKGEVLLKDNIRKSMDYEVGMVFLFLWVALSVITILLIW